MGLTKGVRFVNLAAFVGRLDEGAWDDLLASLPEAHREPLRAPVAAEWYDHALHAHLVRSLCARFGGLARAEALGRFEADRDFTTDERWFLRLIKPSFAIGDMNVYWCRAQDTGRWTSEVRGGAITARLHGWDPVEPALCRLLQGYLGRTLELFGGGEVHVEHTRCRADGEAFCEFHTRSFPLDVEPPRDLSTIGADDLSDIAYELAQLTSLDALAEALVKVLTERLAMIYVALWARTSPDDALRLIRAAGERGAACPRQFVLQTGGRPVGRLDVEVAEGTVDPTILEPLLEGFAIALRGVLAAPPPPPSPPHTPADRAQRLALLRGRWKLTERQSEVLERMVRGMTNKEIAHELGCQEGTVEVHVTQLFKKSGAGNRATLVARFWSEP